MRRRAAGDGETELISCVEVLRVMDIPVFILAAV